MFLIVIAARELKLFDVTKIRITYLVQDFKISELQV